MNSERGTMGVHSTISCALQATLLNPELSLLYSNATHFWLACVFQKALSLNRKTSRAKESTTALNCLFQGLFIANVTELGTENYTVLICFIPATRHYSFLFHFWVGSSTSYIQYFFLCIYVYTAVNSHFNLFDQSLA